MCNYVTHKKFSTSTTTSKIAGSETIAIAILACVPAYAVVVAVCQLLNKDYYYYYYHYHFYVT